jgi:crotonobetainyl-CoA:carnitine CoA-transferase CaiB-like acyl-CoA transferase
MSHLGQVLPVARACDLGTGLSVVCILAAVTSANTALRAAPNLGRHNAEIFGSVGVRQAELKELQAGGVV